MKDEKKDLHTKENKINIGNFNSTEKSKSENSKTDKVKKIQSTDFEQYLNEILKGSDSILGC